MLVTKCDICGKEMPLKSSRYKVSFDGWLYKEDKEICVSCFERIKEEIVQADTPQPGSAITRNSLRTDCSGCRFIGTYDTEFPCANCVRKNKDYYNSEHTEGSK